MPTPTDVLSYEVRDRKAYITMNRPERMNALSRELMRGLAEAFAEADADENVFVVILTGAGGRAFSAGADLKDPPLLRGVERDVFGRLRTRPHEAHVPHQHVHELRQLVEVPAPQESADPRDPGVVRGADVGGETVGVTDHRAKFEDREGEALATNADLTEQRRPR